MPIYAYRCESCGHAKDVLQKVSDPLLTTCPACHAETFKKQLTAAGFQLKGSGWYVTDFRNGNANPKAEPVAGAPIVPKADGSASDGAKTDAPKTDAAKTESTTAPASSTASTTSGGDSGPSGGSGSSNASV